MQTNNSINENNSIYIILILGACVITIGTFGYMIIEKYSLSEGIYMSVVTISTVGFREVKPLSELGRWFTIFLIALGFGTLAFTGNVMAEILLKKTWNNKFGVKKMKKRISRLTGHYIICGAGKVGSASADFLKETGIKFVVIENNEKRYNEIQEKKYICIQGDATREAVLREAGVKKAKGVLALLNSDPENLFVVLSSRELNPTLHIIARAEVISSEKKILRAGADSVSSPYATAGKQIAMEMLAITEKLYFKKPLLTKVKVVPEWITIKEGSGMHGQTVNSIAEQMTKEIIGLRRDTCDFIFPDRNMMLEAGDKFLIIDEQRFLDNLALEVPEKPTIIMIDDNPVILRLYARLFQKAGFSPSTAANGHDGLSMILKEKPVVAIIDYMLPGLSGIDVCKKIREKNEYDEVKLILFTADNKHSIKKLALEAGIDAVVVKNSEASELIETTLKLIKTKKPKTQKEPDEL